MYLSLPESAEESDLANCEESAPSYALSCMGDPATQKHNCNQYSIIKIANANYHTLYASLVTSRQALIGDHGALSGTMAP